MLYLHVSTSPQLAPSTCRSPVQAVGRAVLCCGTGTHGAISAAQQAAYTSGADPLPTSSAHRHSGPGMLIFCFGHRKAFQTDRRKAGKPSSSGGPERGDGVPFWESSVSIVLTWHVGTCLPENLPWGEVQGGILFSSNAPN